jgi:hypothetical protein
MQVSQVQYDNTVAVQSRCHVPLDASEVKHDYTLVAFDVNQGQPVAYQLI